MVSTRIFHKKNKFKFKLKVILLASLLLLITISFDKVFASTNISSCTTLSTPGETYLLTANITQSASCLIVAADGIIIDGQGHTIESTSGYVIDARSSTPGANGHDFTLRNADILAGDIIASGADAVVPGSDGGNGASITLQYVIMGSGVDVISDGGAGLQGADGANGAPGTDANGTNGINGNDTSGESGTSGSPGGVAGNGGDGVSGGNGGDGGVGGNIVANAVRAVSTNFSAGGGYAGAGGAAGNGGTGGAANGGAGGNGGSGTYFGEGFGDGGAGGAGGDGGAGGIAGNGGSAGEGGNGGTGGTGGNVSITNMIGIGSVSVVGAGEGGAGGTGVGGAPGNAAGGSGGNGGAGGVGGSEGGNQGETGASGNPGADGTPGSVGNDSMLTPSSGVPGDAGSSGDGDTLPYFSSALVDASGTHVIITFSEFITEDGLSTGTFSVDADGNSLDILDTDIIGLGYQIDVALGETITEGQDVSLYYPGGGIISDYNTQQMNPVSDFTVTNNSEQGGADVTAPTITNISSNASNGTYKIGQVIDIDVTFSEAVTSTGNVTVTLETGATDRTCTFTISNSTTGTCDYTVQAGDTSSDLDAIVSGTIADQSANAMVSFTPATSLATNRGLIIDGIAPSVSITAPANAEVISGFVNFTASASDNIGVIGVLFKYNNTLIDSEDLVSTYGVSFDTTDGVPDGAYTLYAIARDSAGNRATSSIVVTVDNNIPTISNIATSTGTSTATITWDTTGVISDSLVEYGLSSAYTASSTYSSSLVTSHSRTLTGLTPNTTYHFRAKSVDGQGNVATSSDYTFTTTAVPDSTAPAISSIDADVTGTSTVVITWTTDENATSTVLFGTTTAYGTASSSLTSTTSHSFTLSGLTQSTTYYYKVISSDASNNVSSSTGSFVTDTPDVTAPAFSGATAIGTTLTLTYDDSLDTGSTPATSTFTVLINGSPVTISAVQVTGSTVVLTLDSTITYGQTIVLSYTVPGSNPIQDATGNDSSALSSVSVTNTTSAPASSGGSSGSWSAPTGGGSGGGSSGGGWSTPSTNTVNNTVTSTTTVTTNTTPTTVTPKIVVPLTKTTQVCTPYITSLAVIKLGAKNNPEVVKKIQTYLNIYEGNTLVVDGIYKQVDVNAVKAFQTKYRTQILSPWGFVLPTGQISTTSIAKMNAVVCGENLGCPVFTEKTDVKSDHEEVPHIKNFLNQTLGTNLNTNSTQMDLATVRAISSFQTRYKDYVLKPLGLTRATGLWYESTMKQANGFMGCPTK